MGYVYNLKREISDLRDNAKKNQERLNLYGEILKLIEKILKSKEELTSDQLLRRDAMLADIIGDLEFSTRVSWLHSESYCNDDLNRLKHPKYKDESKPSTMSDHDAHCLAMDICEEMGWDYD